MRPLACLCLLALGAAAAEAEAEAQEVRAEEPRVISPRPDSVSVTIYRDLFALVTETRTVDLPAGPVTLVFDGVVESLLPQSAVVADTGRALRETNHDSEVLSPETLLSKAIGREVLLTRTNPATGKVRQVPARLVAANSGGVIFETTDGTEALHCSGLPERLSFEEIPGELTAKPSLSIRLEAGGAGKRQVRLSYLAHGFAWSADYVGNLADNGRMDLLGWITLHNLTQADFRGAAVQVVAGRLNLLDFEESRGTSVIGATREFPVDDMLDDARAEALEEAREDPDFLAGLSGQDFEHFRGCYPLSTDLVVEMIGKFPDLDLAESLQRMPGVSVGEDLEEIVVTGHRMSIAEHVKLADYQMYRLPGPTDLAARQTKQVAFLHKPDVRVEKFYGIRIGDQLRASELAAEENFSPIAVNVGWRNREADGLGEPLPGGVVRFFESGPAGTVFIGSDRLRDTSVDTPVELRIGQSVDVGITFDGTGAEPVPTRMSRLTRRVYLPVSLRIYNDKSRAVLVEIRQKPLNDFQDLRILDPSVAPKRKAGDYVWRFEVPARGEQELSYKIGGRAPDWMH